MTAAPDTASPMTPSMSPTRVRTRSHAARIRFCSDLQDAGTAGRQTRWRSGRAASRRSTIVSADGRHHRQADDPGDAAPREERATAARRRRSPGRRARPAGSRCGGRSTAGGRGRTRCCRRPASAPSAERARRIRVSQFVTVVISEDHEGDAGQPPHDAPCRRRRRRVDAPVDDLLGEDRHQHAAAGTDEGEGDRERRGPRAARG